MKGKQPAVEEIMSKLYHIKKLVNRDMQLNKEWPYQCYHCDENSS